MGEEVSYVLEVWYSLVDAQPFVEALEQAYVSKGLGAGIGFEAGLGEGMG